MANKKLKGITYKGRIYTPITADAVDDLRGFGDIGGIPSRNERVYLPGEQRSLPSSSYDIHVRISKEDLGLLEKLPESDDGLIAEFLERAHKKVLDTGHAECLSAEAEVDAVVNALQNFIHNDQAQLKDKAHASDMASYWKRNYVIKDTGSKPLQSRQQPKLPPSSNVRMFSYRGAKAVMYKGKKYVRVADEREPPELVKNVPKNLWDVFVDHAFSDIVLGIRPRITENIPVAQMKRDIDTTDQTRQNIQAVNAYLNGDEGALENAPQGPNPRWLTDAFFKGTGADYLRAMVDDPEKVKQALNSYIWGINQYSAALESAQQMARDMLKRAEQYASKYKMKKERKTQKEELLKTFYGFSDREVQRHLDNAYAQAKENAAKQRGGPAKQETKKGNE